MCSMNKCYSVHLQETELRYKFDEIISTRRLQTDDRTHYLEMKCGDLMKQKVTRLETDQVRNKST